MDKISRIFNSSIASASISAAFELGLLEELQRAEVVRVEAYCRERDLHPPSLLAILKAMASQGIVELKADLTAARRGPLFAETYRYQSYFYWLHRGYGWLLLNLAALTSNRDSRGEIVHRNRDFVHRDPAAIARAGQEYGERFVDRIFEEVLGDQPRMVAADLGCGGASRLIRLARRWPQFRGIGVDTSSEAVALANHAIESLGLQGRIKVVPGDVENLSVRPEFAEVQVLISLFLMHEFWPHDSCLRVLRGIADAFPNARRFVICDTYRSDADPNKDAPIFTLGFEVSHAIMGRYIPSLSEWDRLFAEVGWSCLGTYRVGVPHSVLFDLVLPGAPPAHQVGRAASASVTAVDEIDSPNKR
jgi:hypothetical protein